MVSDILTASVRRLRAAAGEPVASTGEAPPPGLDAARAEDLVTDMVRSRLLDVAARALRARGLGWYTIASAGHELTAVVGAHLRRTDPCLLHYRDGGLVMAKARTHPDDDHDVLAATVAGLVASAEDPASGGRHKVWGDPATWVIPQTSTVGSHPPKAVGMAAMLARAGRLAARPTLPEDAVVVASIGDASANHATTLSALTAARWAQRHGNPVPLLLVVEDNGRGISVPTPSRWIVDSMSHLPGLAFHDAEGEVDQVWALVAEVVTQVREQRRPVVLRLPTVRLGGHAGSDVETAYRRPLHVRADLDRDPLRLATVRLRQLGVLTGTRLRAILDRTEERLDELMATAGEHRPLDSAAAVMAPLAPHRPEVVARAARASAAAGSGPARSGTGDGDRLTLAQAINATLHEQLEARPDALVFGQDVAAMGGVYGLTRGLQDRFGRARVFDTLLDETTILGTAQGAALLGLLPIPEVQYLAYLHNALDQVRGEAASTRFFSGGAFATPMVLRVAGLAYQEGIGGHFHNDNAIGALRDIPGLRVAVPSRPDDAVGILRAALAMAAEDDNVVVVLEPIALYHRRDLHEPGDDGWLTARPGADHVLLPGELGVERPDARDLAIVTWGNGTWLSRRAARTLAEGGIATRVVDLRWLAPLPRAALRAAVADCDAVLVADEARASGGGIADAVVADLALHGRGGRLGAVTSRDSFVPTGPAADHVLLGVDDIVAAARRLLADGPGRTPSRGTP